MVIFSEPKGLRDYLLAQRKEGKRIGFVPTMGALHNGHLSLVGKAKSSCDIAVVSIFVNPTQFNDSSDLEKYPRHVEADCDLLKSVDCDVVFLPKVEHIYPEGTKDTRTYDYGLLTSVMEAESRQGHFDGVITVVRKFLQMVAPDAAFFGQKDFQQLAIIRHMVRSEGIPTTIVSCEIIREKDGLAMSSRNERLSDEGRRISKLLSKCLFKVDELRLTKSIEEVQKWIEDQFDSEPLAKLEYFCVSDAQTLEPCSSWRDAFEMVCCIAVFVGEVRLIDNQIIKA